MRVLRPVFEREAALVRDGLECFEAGDDHERVDGTLRRPVRGEFVARVEARDELGDCHAARIEVGRLEHRGHVGVAARGLEDRPSPGLGVVVEPGVLLHEIDQRGPDVFLEARATDAVDVELGEGPPGQRFEQAGLVLEMVVDGDA